MKAQDVMTAQVVLAAPDTPTAQIARLLLEHQISSVPILNGDGAPVGIVSEGDLMGRNDNDPQARRDWWLTLLAEGEPLNEEFLTSLRTNDRTARDVMSSPVVTVSELTGEHDIACLPTAQRIKRVPVLRDGRMVGIVSRADLLRALAEGPETSATKPEPKRQGSGLLGMFLQPDAARPLSHDNEVKTAETPGLSADEFRALEETFRQGRDARKDEARHAAAAQLQQRVKALIDHHIRNDEWGALLHRVREAAAKGELEFLMLRFPSDLCSDGGRAINNSLDGWPATLRGEAAELYRDWERDLHPHGFTLTARVLDFPGGFPGDIGLFLVWGWAS